MTKKKQRILGMLLSLAFAAAMIPAAEVLADGSSPYLFDLEFNGNDQKNGWTWVKNTTTDAIALDTKAPEAGGYLAMNAFDAGSQVASIRLDTPIDISGKKNIMAETRIRLSKGMEQVTEPTTDKPIFSLVSSTNTVYAVVPPVSVANGAYMGVAGTGKGNCTPTQYSLGFGTWYTLRAKFDATTQKFSVYITDDLGNSYQTEEMDKIYPKDFKVQQIDFISFVYTWQMSMDLDYIRIWDNDALPAVSVTYANGSALNGAVDVDTAFEAVVSFENPVTQSDIDTITIDNGSITGKTLSADGKTATLSISGLDYRTKNVLIVPAIGMNASASASFITKDDPRYIFRAEFDGLDDMSKWAVFNSSGNYAAQWDNTRPQPNNGEIVVNAFGASYGWWGVHYGEGTSAYPVSDEDVLGFETKFSLENTTNLNLFRLISKRINKSTNAQDKEFPVAVEAKDSTLIINNQSADAIAYALNTNVWYTLKLTADFSSQTLAGEISGSDGTHASFSQDFINGSAYRYEDIISVVVLANNVNTEKKHIDYARLWKEEKEALLSDPISPVANVETFNGATNTYSKAFNIEGLDWSLYKSIIVKSGDEVKGKSFTALGINNNISGEGSVGIIVNGLPQSNAAIRFTDKEIE